jgi:acyl-CoA hydrolase
MFVSEAIRKDVNEGRADYIPVFLSEIPELFKQNILQLDVALVQVSPPDDHGYCSLGVSVDIARSAVNTCQTYHCPGKSECAPHAWRWFDT